LKKWDKFKDRSGGNTVRGSPEGADKPLRWHFSEFECVFGNEDHQTETRPGISALDFRDKVDSKMARCCRLPDWFRINLQCAIVFPEETVDLS
jgi:hypothetical protein